LKFTKASQPIGQKKYVELSKDIFIFSYLCGGINFTDIANLTRENIVNDRLHYIRQKTGKPIKIGIPQEAMLIIEKYSKESNGYLFPILDNKVHKTALQKQNRIHKIRGKVNEILKILGKRLGIEANITTYVARHSFASVLKKSGVNIALISEALGHSDLATTQIYLDSFDNEQVDKANEEFTLKSLPCE
jgi:Site-specific recombinase XerD